MIYAKIITALLLPIILAIGLTGCSGGQQQQGEQQPGEQQQEDSSKEIIYVGTFADRGGEGLYVFEFNRETGGLSQIQTVSDREAPDFQALHPAGPYLYSVSDESFSG